MSRNLLESGEFCPADLTSNIFLNWQRKIYLLLAVLLLILFIAVPVSAAVGGFVAKDNSGSYHQYDYEELLDSYALKIIGKSNGLYEDFAAKKAYAILSKVNGYVDYESILDHYAGATINGTKFNLADYLQSKSVVKAKLPPAIKMVTTEPGKLVRTELNTGENNESTGDGGSDSDSGLKPGNGDDTVVDPETEYKVPATPLVAKASVTLETAKKWAAGKNAHQRFIDIAALYWKYGKLTGIAPEVLYAQAALETGYGRYGGQVPANYNNWAGIKIATSNGDKPEDHQQFATPEDGVRGHFNHIAAYVGLKPVGEPHGRYHVVLTTPWSGTIKTVEELSGKWAPSETYHERIISLLGEMVNQ